MKFINKKLIFIVLTLLLQFAFGEISFAEEKRSYDWFWLFYEKDINQNYEARVYRPFYLIHKTSKNIFDASLMPIIFWRYRTENKETWNAYQKAVISLSKYYQALQEVVKMDSVDKEKESIWNSDKYAGPAIYNPVKEIQAGYNEVLNMTTHPILRRMIEKQAQTLSSFRIVSR